MSKMDKYIDWRESIENVYFMYGSEVAIKSIYEPNQDISLEAQQIAEATIHLRTGETTKSYQLVEPLLPKLDGLLEDQKKDTLIILANYLLESKATEKLNEILDKALNSFPNELEFHILQAKLKQIVDGTSLQKSLSLLLDKFSTSAKLLTEIGDSFFQNYENEKARKNAQKALSIDPNNVRALNLMGYIELESENDELAYDYFARSAEIWPFQIKTLYTLIDVTLLLQDWEGACKAFEYSLNYFPSDPKLLLDFASFLIKTTILPPKSVEEYLRSVTTKLPENPHAHQYLAYFLSNNGNLQEAKREIERSLLIETSESAIKLKNRIDSCLNAERQE